MQQHTYTIVSGVLFAIIAILHVFRVAYGWEAVIGGWTAPMWISWVAALIIGVLAITAFKLSRR